LPVCRVGGATLCDFRFEAVAQRQQLRLGDDVPASVLERVFVDVGLDDRVHRARLLAEAAENALEQVDFVARGAPRVVLALFGIDGDGQRRTHGLAQLAGDAAFFAVRGAAQRVPPAEARGPRARLHRVPPRVLGVPEAPDVRLQAPDALDQQQAPGPGNELAHHAPASNTPKYAINAVTAIQAMDSGMNTFQPRRMIWS